MSIGEDVTPSVTVLLPVHNGGRHLASAVASILQQTHSHFELLVIDDGSTDGSSAELDSLDDPRVRVIHQENVGLVRALNRGLDEARFALVARMDADDVSHPRRLELQVKHLSEHRDVAAVGSCYRVIDELGTEVSTVHAAASAAYLSRQLSFRNVLAHAGMTFRRDIVRSVGGYREVGPAEDYDLWLRLTAAGHRIACLPDLLLQYRRTASGISGQSRELQLRATREVRDTAGSQLPVTARGVAREGRHHVATYESTCPGAGRNYVFDHAWLALLAAKRGRYATATKIALGVVALAARRPASAAGLVDVLRRP